MAKLEAIEGEGAVQQRTGTVQELPTAMMQHPLVMGTVQEPPSGMMQQPPVMMQHPHVTGMVQELPTAMMQHPPQMLPAATFVQPQEQPIRTNGTFVDYSTCPMLPPANLGPPQEQPNTPNGTFVDYSTSHLMDVGIPWTTGMFDCFQNPTNAIITAYLPCITFGQIAEVLDDGEMNCALGAYIYLAMMPALCSHWLMGSKYRAKLRRRYNLVEAPFPDVVSHIFCPCCALAQEFRELKSRGLDPALGWKQIVNQQIQNPPQTQAMTR